MSVFHPEVVQCACGAALTVQLADSVNVGVRPQLREDILAGALHRFRCDACGRTVLVETTFLYSDFQRNLLLLVLPPAQADRQQAVVAEVEHAASAVPGSVATGVVMGIDALRERLVADDAGAGESPLAVPRHRPFWARLWPGAHTPAAVAQLRVCADAVVKARWPDIESPGFVAMLAGLPRGARLSERARADLRTLLSFAKTKNHQKLQDDLFEIRFGFALDDAWWRNDDPDDIETLWRVLDALPETHATGNGWIREIDLAPEGDPKLAGSYSQATREISIAPTELGQPESLRRVIRHEVGHAVHASQEQVVTDWLGTRFGWRSFSLDDDGIDEWVRLAGGWGGLWEDDRRAVRAVLRAAVGPGSRWTPGPLPELTTTHPWHRPAFGPRLAFEQTGTDWYERYRSWHRVGGTAVFLNSWYATLMAVDLPTLDIVARMPRSFAAMSPKEFFAELYALYHDLDDRRRDDLPADVTAWMARTIGPAVAPR